MRFAENSRVSERAIVEPARQAIISASDRVLPFLLLLFVASGCAALIYEIVWFQLLELVIGSSTVSLGILLATYMGGLCLGSLGLSRLVSPRPSPLLVYGILELGIGALAIMLLFGLPLVGSIYVTFAAHGSASIALRGIMCALLLLPPTALMGATLPAIARWVDTSPTGVSWLGLLYSGNIAGAVLGCLIAGFYLLRLYDMAVATYVAATINVALAIIAFALAAATASKSRTAKAPAGIPAGHRSDVWPVYGVIGFSGMTALGSQVVWTRVLALLLGATVYSFSIILAVFLIGLGCGGGLGSFLARTATRPRLMLAVCQLLLAICIGWAATMINGSLPYWPVFPSLTSSPWYNFQLDLARVAWAIFPATLLWGASFPLALAAAASPNEDAGRMAGAIYAANTVGAIIGALAFSILLVPSVGTYQSQRLLIAICLMAGLLMLVTLVPHRKSGNAASEQPLSASKGASAGLAAVVVTGAMIWTIPGLPGGLVAFGRELPRWLPLPQLLFVGEGINSSVAVTQLADGIRSFHVSGRPEASTTPHDMRVERMLGHLPGLIHPQARSVLIVGFGAGITAGSFVLYPGIERIVICEIEPLIPKMVAGYFSKQNYDVLKDTRVEVIYDDARHYLLTTREKFDIITSDPIHPWVKGSATLYTEEYFKLVKAHLNPGGLVTQWVPLYESTPDVVKSQLATFFRVFPSGVIFGNEGNVNDTDTVLFGAVQPRPIEPDAMQKRLTSPDYWRVRQSLAEVNIHSAVELLATYAGRAQDLANWLQDGQINSDLNLRLQYLAGMSSSAVQANVIYEDLLRKRRFPQNLFIASNETTEILRQMLMAHGPEQ